MDRTRPWTRALAGACALTLLFAACGDDEDDGGDTSDSTEQTTEAADDTTTESSEPADETTAPEEETTTSEAEGDPEAVATAEEINLELEDFAEGWVEEPAEEEDSSDDIDQCFTTVDIAGTTLGEAETPTFTVETPDGQGGQLVSMQTVVFDTPETATAVVAEVGTPEFAACIQGTITDDGDGADASLTPLVDDPPVGEESAGVAGAVAIPAGEDGTTQPAQADLHVIRTGAIASFTITLDVGETPDEAFQSTLADLYTLIAQRQAAAA